uniref:Ig-like domain-containing protein n=1 Tax=Oreochromis aureus TaxID=47969 RepID=A0A668UPJ1_OREAU
MGQHKANCRHTADPVLAQNSFSSGPRCQPNVITAESESGQTVTLLCRAQSNKPIDTVTWNRSDIADKNVLKYHGQQLLLSYQHPSFKNRVDMQNRQMKDGDVSLILKDVMINDAGTYECRVIQRGINQEELIIELSVCVIRDRQTEESLSSTRYQSKSSVP